VSVVIIIFLFHSFGVDSILTSDRRARSFIRCTTSCHSTSCRSAFGVGDWRPRGRRYLMVENGYRQLSEHHPPKPVLFLSRRDGKSSWIRETGGSRYFLFAGNHCGFLPACLFTGGTGRTHVSSVGVDEDAVVAFLRLGYHACAVLMILFIRGRLIPNHGTHFKNHPGSLFAGSTLCLRFRKTTLLLNLVFLVVTLPLALHIGSQFMPPLFEGRLSTCDSLARNLHRAGIAIAPRTGSDHSHVPGSGEVFGSIGRSDSRQQRSSRYV